MKKKERFCIGVPEIDREIERLSEKYSHGRTNEYFRQLFTTIVKLYLDKADEEDLHLLNISIKELRHAFRVFKSYRDVRKVSIFGSHRSPRDSVEYRMAEEFCGKIAEKGFMVITGGGGGIMEAGNKAAREKSFAAKIRISIESPNPFIPKGDRMIMFNYFFNRKLVFIKESDATVLFPGGFGTMDEGFEALTLLQTGKCPPRPIVMVEDVKTGYWKGWEHFVRGKMVKKGLLRDIDLDLYRIVKSVPQAIKEVVDFFKIYNSTRFIKDLTVIRMEKQLSSAAYKELNREFKDILVKGKIEPCLPQSAEKKDRDRLFLPRMKMYFDQRSFTRLLQLVRRINTYAD
ncbi:MAG: LOG family protein [Candidatus Margulisbacteria bacterium]|nr:LOG family protein [Candidatus Margulisiibacteriota bacterium]